MSVIDIVILGLLAFSIGLGWFRGFFTEAISLFTWIAAIWIGWKYGYVAEGWVDGRLASDAAEMWAGRIIMFGIVVLIGGVVGQLVALGIEKTGMTLTDRTLGMMFGLIRGLIVFGFVIILAQRAGFGADTWWTDSTTIPYGEEVSEWIRAVLPEDFDDLLKPIDPLLDKAEMLQDVNPSAGEELDRPEEE